LRVACGHASIAARAGLKARHYAPLFAVGLHVPWCCVKKSQLSVTATDAKLNSPTAQTP
jgi:hypothetical protein